MSFSLVITHPHGASGPFFFESFPRPLRLWRRPTVFFLSFVPRPFWLLPSGVFLTAKQWAPIFRPPPPLHFRFGTVPLSPPVFAWRSAVLFLWTTLVSGFFQRRFFRLFPWYMSECWTLVAAQAFPPPPRPSPFCVFCNRPTFVQALFVFPC